MRSPFLKLLAPLLGAVLLSGCASAPAPITFDLTAPRDLTSSLGKRGAIVVAEPLALQTLDSDRLIVKDTAGSLSFLPGAQWSDRLPRLFQTRLIQTFENAARARLVGRPSDRLSSDYQLITDIRSFQIESASGEAVVEVSAKLLDEKTSRIVAARLFSARQPLSGSVETVKAAKALDDALSTVLVEIVRWAK